MTEVRKAVNAKEMEAALKIREAVFVQEQGVPREEEYDDHDKNATHFVAYDAQNKPCGTARWRQTRTGIKLERFAVLPPYRKTGVGTALLKSLLYDIEEDPNVTEQKIYMHAQASAVGFYRKFGFEPVGDEFDECGIKHFEMVR